MKKTVTNCYCDVLSEHNNQEVAGATTYKNISVMVSDGENTYIKEMDIDLCPACKAKYATNLYYAVNALGRASLKFSDNT